MNVPAERDPRVGFIAAFANPESARETATTAEARGYDSLWVGGDGGLEVLLVASSEHGRRWKASMVSHKGFRRPMKC